MKQHTRNAVFPQGTLGSNPRLSAKYQGGAVGSPLIFGLNSEGFEVEHRPPGGRTRRCSAGFCQKARKRSSECKLKTHLLQKESQTLVVADCISLATAFLKAISRSFRRSSSPQKTTLAPPVRLQARSQRLRGATTLLRFFHCLLRSDVIALTLRSPRPVLSPAHPPKRSSMCNQGANRCSLCPSHSCICFMGTPFASRSDAHECLRS